MNLNPKTWWCLHDWKVLHEKHIPSALAKITGSGAHLEHVAPWVCQEVHATTIQCVKCGKLVTRTARNPP